MPDPKQTPEDFDLINRSQKGTNALANATFVGLRAADPFLQYNILSNGATTALISRLGGTVLPKGPALVTNTLLDGYIGLSPYRSILLAMSCGSMLKQNFTLLALTNEEMTVGASAAIGAFNALLNSVNSFLFVCAQTSASVNGEHFPQTPLIVGASLYLLGIGLEQVSEIQRSVWKRNAANKGKVYEGGLFGLSRHINYFGYTLWRSGYALAAGGWIWGSVVAAWFSYDFVQRAIPVLQTHMERKYGEQYEHYERTVPYKFVPFLY